MHDIKSVLNKAIGAIPRLDAEVLLAETLAKPRSFLRAHDEFILNHEQYATFTAQCLRRANGEPLAYILGHKEFWSLDFEVTSATLIPRPETEHIVEWVLTHFKAQRHLKVADLGTGSGAIALALAHSRPEWSIVATDISQAALTIASKNAQKMKIDNISFFCGDWCTALPFNDFDVIVSNPPYVAVHEWQTYADGLRYEPQHALLAGEDGLEAIKSICKTVKNYLKPNGYVMVEHGFLQGMAVRNLFTAAGINAVETVQDHSGHERITFGQYVVA
jgi:release factor glutamine methyltransferase